MKTRIIIKCFFTFISQVPNNLYIALKFSHIRQQCHGIMNKKMSCCSQEVLLFVAFLCSWTLKSARQICI